MNMINTSECEECIYGIIDDSSKCCVKVICTQKGKEYYYGQYIPCDNNDKKMKRRGEY